MSHNRLRLKPVFYLLMMFMLTAVTLSGCGGEPEREMNHSLSIFVSVPPQVDIIRQLAGRDLTVRSLVQPGQSPATYDPTPRQMAQLAEADLCFLIGVPFEDRFVERAQSVLRSVLIVESQAGIPLRKLTRPGHYEGESYSETGHDPHVWLSPTLMKQIAGNMADGLKQVDSANSEKYAENLSRLLIRLDSLHSEIREILAPFAGDTLYVFHPSYGYFADEYGLIQVPLEPEGKEADAAYLARLMNDLTRKKVAGIFVQPQFSDHLARSVASQIGTDLVLLDPLGEDYFENMIQMAQTVAEVLSGKGNQGDSLSDERS